MLWVRFFLYIWTKNLEFNLIIILFEPMALLTPIKTQR